MTCSNYSAARVATKPGKSVKIREFYVQPGNMRVKGEIFEKSGNIREVVPIFHKKNFMFHLIVSFWHILLLIPLIFTLLDFC